MFQYPKITGNMAIMPILLAIAPDPGIIFAGAYPKPWDKPLLG
jgi:hypothetical protein